MIHIEKTIFQEVEGEIKKGDILLSGREISKVEVLPSTNADGTFCLSLKLNETGKQRFKEASERLTGKQIGIFVGKELLSAPTIIEPITTGELVITSSFSLDIATKFADRIKVSRAPFDMKLIQ